MDLAVTVGAGRAVEIVPGYHSDDMVGVVGELRPSTTPCGDAIREGSFATATTSQFSVRAAGFGGGGEPGATPPTAAWTVGGVPVSGTGGKIDVPVGDVTFEVEYTVDPVVFELGLTSRGGERYETPVTVIVTGGGSTATASTTFSALGWFDGIHPDDIGIFSNCLRRIIGKYRVVVAPPFRKPSPDPPWATPLVRRQRDVVWFDKAMRLIPRLPGLVMEGRTALMQLVEAQVQPVPTMLERLDVIGVDYSVPEADITDWLNNPEFTPYPALANSLLNLLDGKRLRRPVYLDVIAFNYENSPGSPSPRGLDDVDLGVLEAAVVEGSNNRYGEAVPNFEELLAP